jgi:hypothetical protein
MAMVLFPAGRTYADDPAAADRMTGTWQGQTNTGSRPVGITFMVDPLKTNKPNVRFSPP